jgi:hypothetical protein
VTAHGDPASPRFDADEPRVVRTPFGRLNDEHPLGRAIGALTFPAATERVLSRVRDDPSVTDEQAAWLEAVLPAGRTFESRDELVEAAGVSGPPPPGAAAGI